MQEHSSQNICSAGILEDLKFLINSLPPALRDETIADVKYVLAELSREFGEQTVLVV